MKTTRKLKSKTIAYYVFPEGIRKETLEAALAIRKPGDWIREYTVICKEIIITNGAEVVAVADGTYMQGKEIRNAELPKPVKP